MKDLFEARDSWYRAFYAGDADELARFEADDFFVVSEMGRQTKHEQMKSMKKSVDEGSWFPVIPSRKEYHVSQVKISDGVVVSGVGHTIVNANIVAKHMFTEIWVIDSTRWCIKALHYSPIQRKIKNA